jgi:hypothetical protein
MSETHSKLSPSKAHRYLRCPVSAIRVQKYPETTSEYAEEGRLAHELAAAILTKQPRPKDVPDEMRGYIKTYLDTLASMSQGATDIWVEEAVDLSPILGEGEKGTADYIAIVGNELQVHDLKYGKGVPVEAQDNEQLILYGLGALDIAMLIGDITTVRTVIHQPRLNSVSEAVYTVDQIQGWGARIKPVAEIIRGMSEDDPACPGEVQCRWCPAKADCTELAATVKDTVIGDFDNLDDPKAIEAHIVAAPESVIAEGMRILPLVKIWVKAIEDTAMERLLNGVPIEGFKLVEGRAGSRQWTSAEDAESAMKAMRLKVDEMYDKKVISPTSAEKLLAKSSPSKWAKLQEFISRKPPAPAVVPESDKRPALDTKASVDEFDDIT